MRPREPLTYGISIPPHTSKVRLAQLASRQCGLVTWAQLEAIGLAPATIRWWVAGGYLIRVMPRVYAVGHRPTDERSALFSLVLFAGPRAALSHGTAAHWRGWLRYPVSAIHISTPRRIRTRIPGVTVHGSRDIPREIVNGVPCTTLTQTLLDVAATEPPRLVDRCLAQLDYDRALSARAIRAACGRGRPGSAALLRSLNTYMPQLARTRSDLEDDFLYLCRRYGLPLPQVNTIVHGIEVDCHWPEAGLVVELDGGRNHGTSAQRNRDHRRSLTLRARGLAVLRYDPQQVNEDAPTVAADVRRQLERAERLKYPA